MPEPIVLQFAAFSTVTAVTGGMAVVLLAADGRRPWNQWLASRALASEPSARFRSASPMRAALGVLPATARKTKRNLGVASRDPQPGG